MISVLNVLHHTLKFLLPLLIIYFLNFVPITRFDYRIYSLFHSAHTVFINVEFIFMQKMRLNFILEGCGKYLSKFSLTRSVIIGVYYIISENAYFPQAPGYFCFKLLRVGKICITVVFLYSIQYCS